ncbi:MAG: hypothetical protein Q8908_08370 [Bacteroidota bacterium]|nr:hypothetical protein [Bacteroidota bacterium]
MGKCVHRLPIDEFCKQGMRQQPHSAHYYFLLAGKKNAKAIFVKPWFFIERV